MGDSKTTIQPHDYEPTGSDGVVDVFDAAGEASRPKLPGGDKNKRMKWTPDQIRFVEIHSLDMSDREMAKALGVSYEQVKFRRRRMGLIKRNSPSSSDSLPLGKPRVEDIIQETAKQQTERDRTEDIRLAVIATGLVDETALVNPPPVVQKKFKRIRAYMNLPRLENILGTLTDESEKKYLLREFINLTWNVEQLDAGEMQDVISMIMEELIQLRLWKMYERGKLSTDPAGADQIFVNTVLTQYNESIKRMQVIEKSLHTTREQRIKAKKPTDVSFIDVVEAWVVQRRREKLLQLGAALEEEKQEFLDKNRTQGDSRAVILGLKLDQLDVSDGQDV